MKAIILVAGYATRLYPLTKDKPKALLDIQGKPLLQHIMDDLMKIPQIDQIILVSNHLFFNQFSSWIEACEAKIPVHVIDDGTMTNDMRLGALKDLYFAIEAFHFDDDLLVLAGDNLYDFSMDDFVSFFKKNGHDSVMIHQENNIDNLRKTGVAEVEGHQLISFQEKPKELKGAFAVPPFYIYRKETIPLIKKYVKDNHPSDSPGSLIAWLLERVSIDGFLMPGKRYDIGDLASYEAARNSVQIKR